MLELTKPRITQLVLLTAAAGFYLGARDHVNLALLVNTLIGTALVAGGTNAWNQIRERDVDARMVRTRRRPLPSGRLTTAAAIWFATAITVVGVGYLAVMVNLLTALLAALTFASYVLLYTPLKRKTSLNTLVGAVPGAADRRRMDRCGRQSRRGGGRVVLDPVLVAAAALPRARLAVPRRLPRERPADAESCG